MQETILTAMVAHEFAKVIAAWLDPEEVFEIERKNAATNDGSCHSHDYCDANLAMISAFEQILGREPMMSEENEAEQAQHEADYGLMSAAWNTARAHHLFPLYAQRWIDDDPAMRAEQEKVVTDRIIAYDANAYVEHGGGGATSWWFAIGNVFPHDHPRAGQTERYGLITYRDCEHVGPIEAPQWMVGLYADDGDQILCKAHCTLNQALHFITKWREGLVPGRPETRETPKRTPPQGTVFDYWLKTFGFAPEDDTLLELPCDSNCGDDCVALIDLAKPLVDKADRSCRREILDGVQHAISVFWRG